MPSTQEDHYNYTKNEWNNGYFKTIINILKVNQIKSFIDVGANVGGVADILLENIPTIEKCYLIEPDIENYNWMFDKHKENDKVILLNCGIFYGIKKSSMNKRNNNVGGWSLIKDNSPESNIGKFSFFELEFFNFGKIDFLKMDVEWAEYNIIENSELLKTIDFLEIEMHNGLDIDYLKKYLPKHQVINNDNINVFLKLQNKE